MRWRQTSSVVHIKHHLGQCPGFGLGRFQSTKKFDSVEALNEKLELSSDYVQNSPQFKSPRRPLRTLEHFSLPDCCWPLSICSHCEFTTEQTLVWNTHFIYKTEVSTTSAYCQSKNLIHTLTANNSYTHHDYCVCNQNYVFLHHERPQGFRLCLLGTYVTPVRHSAI